MIRAVRLVTLETLLLAMTLRNTALNERVGISFDDMFLTYEHSNQGRAWPLLPRLDA
jgi:hypothetical protein